MTYTSRPAYINLSSFQKLHLETLKEMWSYQFLKNSVYESYITFSDCPSKIKRYLDREFEKDAFNKAINIIGQSTDNLLSNVFNP